MTHDLKIDLGCGDKKPDGYIGLDVLDFPYEGEFIKRDLRKEGLPFCESSVVEIRAWHFLEHITADEMLYLLHECHRVLKVNGFMHIQVPDGSRQSSWRPIHLQQFGLCYFDYLDNEKWEVVNKNVVRDDTCFEFVLRPIK